MQVAFIDGFPGMPFYFNLSAPVGRGYPNARTDDLALVQFCFAVGATGSAANPVPRDLAGPWSQVRVTGRSDPATQGAIDAWQAFRRRKFGPAFETDGIVSVAATRSGSYAGRDTTYDIVHLNFVMLVATASVWPRIDKAPQCPDALGAAVRQALSSHLTR